MSVKSTFALLSKKCLIKIIYNNYHKIKKKTAIFFQTSLKIYKKIILKLNISSM